MKKLAVILLYAFLLSACQTRPLVKAPEPATAIYIDLKDLSVNASSAQSLDFDGDKKPDLLISTMLVADEKASQTNLQYLAVSRSNSYLLLDNQEDADMNITPIMPAGAIINSKPPGTFHWVNIASVILSEKIMQENKIARWNGIWKNADHNYLLFQLKKPGGNYYGWLEISMDTRSETMTLHRAAISKQPGKIIRTGI